MDKFGCRDVEAVEGDLDDQMEETKKLLRFNTGVDEETSNHLCHKSSARYEWGLFATNILILLKFISIKIIFFTVVLFCFYCIPGMS